jgi:hypothetical protein
MATTMKQKTPLRMTLAMTKLFCPHMDDVRQKMECGDWGIRLLDGCFCHQYDEFPDLFHDVGIAPIFLIAHSSRLTQPLDVGLSAIHRSSIQRVCHEYFSAILTITNCKSHMRFSRDRQSMIGFIATISGQSALVGARWAFPGTAACRGSQNGTAAVIEGSRPANR